MKTLTETKPDAAAEAVVIRKQLDGARTELAAAEATVERLADEVARLLATGSDVSKVEQSVSKAQDLVGTLRSRVAALARLLPKTEAIAAEDAALLAKIDAAERQRAAVAAFGESFARAVCSGKGLTLDLADCARQHGLAQAAAADLGPGNDGGTADLTSWYAQSQLLDEVWTAACSAAGASGESHRVSLTLRIPELRGA